MDLTSKATNMLIRSMKFNQVDMAFVCCESLADIKSLVISWLCKDKKPDESFIKGAKLINWNTVFKVIKIHQFDILQPFIIASLYDY